MQPKNKDSLANTFIVATLLCLLCSFLVSSAALGLKSMQDRNVALDRKKNLLQVTGFDAEAIRQGGGIEKLFGERFDMQIIDLETGAEALDDAKAALAVAGKDLGEESTAILNRYDQVWASKSKKEAISDKITAGEDPAGLKFREKYSHVYVLKDADGKKVSKYVFPVRGKGLWSMMQGFLAVEPDFQTIAGLTFYKQGETPGLGGEVMNPNWKAKWQGKKIYDESGAVDIEVVKGTSNDDFEVDGLSGATITSKGVSNMLDYWLGPEGFGPYIKRQKTSGDSAAQVLETAKGGSRG